ncbi:protein of unknown function [Cupriavidus taiwanensis]|nr:protein of unknown function [Cupriavidus taiwanensis]
MECAIVVCAETQLHVICHVLIGNVLHIIGMHRTRLRGNILCNDYPYGFTVDQIAKLRQEWKNDFPLPMTNDRDRNHCVYHESTVDGSFCMAATGADSATRP